MTARAIVLTAVAVTALAVAPAAPPVAAQDCSIGRYNWHDIQRFWRCIDGLGLKAWSPWILQRPAEYTSNPTMVRLSMQAGADPNAPADNGLTPLHRGAENSNPMVVTPLLNAEADINTKNSEGYTALHWSEATSETRSYASFAPRVHRSGRGLASNPPLSRVD